MAPLRKSLWLVARLVVVAAAVAFLAWNVEWRDSVLLRRGAESLKVPLLASRSQNGIDQFQIKIDGSSRWVDESQLARPKSSRPHELLPLVRPGLRSVVAEMDWRYLTLALAIFAPVYVLQALRLGLLLQAQGFILPRVGAVKMTFAASLLNFVGPTGSTGGDLYKAWFVARQAVGRGVEALTVVLFDRAVGLANMIILAAILLTAGWLTGRTGIAGGYVASVLGVGLIAGGIYFSPRIRQYLRHDTLLSRLPFGKQLLRIDQTAYSMRSHPRALAGAIGLTALAQGCCCLGVMALALAVGMRWSATPAYVMDYSLAVIVGLMVASLPGNPPQGLGVLEGIVGFVLVTQRHYGDFAQVLAICMGLRLMLLVWALPGAIVLLLEPSPRRSASKIESASAAELTGEPVPQGGLVVTALK